MHVSFLPPPPSGAYDDPQERMPIILPMIGKMGVYPNGGDDAPVCYLHGMHLHAGKCTSFNHFEQATFLAVS